MTDDVNVSYSFQLAGNTWPNSTAAQPRTDRRTFAYADCEQVTINDSTMLLINRQTRRKMVVTRDVGNALTHCTNFETLADHTDALCATIPLLRDQHKNVLQVLQSARDAGVLADAEQITLRLNSPPSDSNPAPTRVFIITCDRPLAIERLLTSMLTGCTLTQHEQLFLIDDSRLASNAQLNRRHVAAFNQSSPQAMLYVGAEAAATLLYELVEELPTHESSLRFLLDRIRWADQPTYGLSRNVCLLLSVGYRALVLDDDILCRAIQSPQSKPGMTFSCRDSKEAWFYAAETELQRDSVWCDFDPLLRHAEALGKPLAAVADALNGGPLDPASVDHCNGKMLGVLSGDSPVLITQCGSAGDPGTVNSRWVVNLDQESIARLLSSDADEQALPDSQMCWLGYTRTTVALRGVMSQLTGLDNSQLLPPFAPILRGEDDLFATMTAYLHPASAVLNYNWAVPHLPVDDRSAARVLRPYTGSVSLSTLAAYLRGKIDIHNQASVECRLAALAGEIRAMGECPGAAVLSGCEVELAISRATVVRTLEGCLAADRHTTHHGWQHFIKGYLTEAQAALTAPSTFENGALPEWMGSAQDAALAFADALHAWPLIRSHSIDIAARLIASRKLLP